MWHRLRLHYHNEPEQSTHSPSYTRELRISKNPISKYDLWWIPKKYESLVMSHMKMLQGIKQKLFTWNILHEERWPAD